MTETSARKNDNGKLRWDLLPQSLWYLVHVFTMGAKKYDDWNWRKGFAWSRVFAALMRHAWAWWWGEEYDQEDGQRHLASVAWCALVLLEFEDYGLGKNDRVYPVNKGMNPRQTVEELESEEEEEAFLKRMSEVRQRMEQQFEMARQVTERQRSGVLPEVVE
jgi:hypothetical protein